MVSVAIYRGRELLQREDWNQEERKLAKRMVKETLEGVGDYSTDTPEEGNVSTVIRRLCTDAERMKVLEKYVQEKA